MAIQVSGVNVIDNDRNLNVGILTATSIDVAPAITTFSPTDGSSDNVVTTNIVITYNTTVEKGSGNITLRDGSASGSVIQTIAVSSGSVSISGGVVTINPSDLPTGKDIYVVVDAGAFTSTALGSATDLLNTYNFTTGPVTVSSFSPSDGAADVAIESNIVINFSENVSKGSGNITIRSGSASGTIQQTIDVTSGTVSVSGSQVTINPSDLNHETDTYVVVDAGCFTNTDGDAASGNAIINTYNFTTVVAIPPLGSAHEGGYLICCSGGNLWIVAPSSAEVRAGWHERSTSNACAEQVSGCFGWFIPSRPQLQNPGWQCRTYWDSYSQTYYWANTTAHQYNKAWRVHMDTQLTNTHHKPMDFKIRSFRCVSY